jgi:DNA-binding SARP family transcriptional activator
MPRKRKPDPIAEAPQLPAAPPPAAIADPVMTDPAAYQTLKWILEGHHERDVLAALAETHPTADPHRTLAAVMRHLAALAGADPVILRGFAYAAYRELYARALATGDLANAIRCVKELERLAAQNPPPDPTREPTVV